MFLTALSLLAGCSLPVETTSLTEAVASCSVASAEAGGDISQCSTPVLTVSTNPIVVICPESQARPPASLVGNGMCEQGNSPGVWCCVPMSAVGP